MSGRHCARPLHSSNSTLDLATFAADSSISLPTQAFKSHTMQIQLQRPKDFTAGTHLKRG